MALLSGRNILMIIAPEKFRDEEFEQPFNHFSALGAAITVASLSKGTATGMFGKKVEVKTTLEEVKTGNFDAVVFVGGAGTPNVRANNRAVEIAREAKNRPVAAAICWAPTILAKAGILKGHKATVWLGDDGEYGKKTDKVLELYGATYSSADVTVDGNIVTGNGPQAAQKFAEAISELLTKKPA